jgi:hypothetical protein
VPDEFLIGRDYYVDADGRYVFTEAYLRARGTCCGNACRHCPYGHANVPEPGRGSANESARPARE